jgi:hypothetical protein
MRRQIIKLVLFSSQLLATTVSLGADDPIKLTIYDDGRSCPADCDAHVVFNANLNGTEYAHDPTTASKPFKKCVVGQICQLCLESGGKQCLKVMYRGGGPPPGTFDFTPQFYIAACAETPAQPLLATKCSDLAKTTARVAGRINCIASPAQAPCPHVLQRATLARKQDLLEYDRCLRQGEGKYNKTVSASQRRAHQCAYELNGSGGPNSNNATWKKLLPAACREGTFIGQDGLDCCSGNPFADAQFENECLLFYPKAPPRK